MHLGLFSIYHFLIYITKNFILEGYLNGKIYDEYKKMHGGFPCNERSEEYSVIFRFYNYV